MKDIDTKRLMYEIIQAYNRLTENKKIIEGSKDVVLPTITPQNILFHVVNIILKPYRDKDVLKDNYWSDNVNRLSMVKISYDTQENFCCIAVGSNNCDEEKKIWVFQRYLRNNNYNYGIFVKEYKWHLLKENEIISELDFSNDINISEFNKFICWDKKLNK